MRFFDDEHTPPERKIALLLAAGYDDVGLVYRDEHMAYADAHGVAALWREHHPVLAAVGDAIQRFVRRIDAWRHRCNLPDGLPF